MGAVARRHAGTRELVTATTPIMLDTDVVVHLLQGREDISARVAALQEPALLASITRAELEGGIARGPGEIDAAGRVKLNALLSRMPVIAFDNMAAAAYSRILAERGYSRGKMLDRLIAATAIVAGARLATLNAADFQDISELKLEDWKTEAAS